MYGFMIGFMYVFIRYVRPGTVKALLELGADPYKEAAGDGQQSI